MLYNTLISRKRTVGLPRVKAFLKYLYPLGKEKSRRGCGHTTPYLEAGVGRQDASRLALPGRVGARPTENCAQPAEGQRARRRAQTGRFVCAVPGVPVKRQTVGWKPRAPGHLLSPGPARRSRSRVTAGIAPASPRPGGTLGPQELLQYQHSCGLFSVQERGWG